MKTMTKFLIAMFVMMSIACGDAEQMQPWETPCPFDLQDRSGWFMFRNVEGECGHWNRPADICHQWDLTLGEGNDRICQPYPSTNEECARVWRKRHECIQEWVVDRYNKVL